MKTCYKCKTHKKNCDFHKAAKNSDGLHSYCKECVRANDAARVRVRPGKEPDAAPGAPMQQGLGYHPPYNPIRVEGKACKHCDERKPLSEFYRDNSRPDKATSWCKQCTLENGRKRKQALRAKREEAAEPHIDLGPTADSREDEDHARFQVVYKRMLEKQAEVNGLVIAHKQLLEENLELRRRLNAATFEAKALSDMGEALRTRVNDLKAENDELTVAAIAHSLPAREESKKSWWRRSVRLV